MQGRFIARAEENSDSFVYIIFVNSIDAGQRNCKKMTIALAWLSCLTANIHILFLMRAVVPAPQFVTSTVS